MNINILQPDGLKLGSRSLNQRTLRISGGNLGLRSSGQQVLRKNRDAIIWHLYTKKSIFQSAFEVYLLLQFYSYMLSRDWIGCGAVHSCIATNHIAVIVSRHFHVNIRAWVAIAETIILDLIKPSKITVIRATALPIRIPY